MHWSAKAEWLRDSCGTLVLQPQTSSRLCNERPGRVLLKISNLRSAKLDAPTRLSGSLDLRTRWSGVRRNHTERFRTAFARARRGADAAMESWKRLDSIKMKSSQPADNLQSFAQAAGERFFGLYYIAFGTGDKDIVHTYTAHRLIQEGRCTMLLDSAAS